MLKTYGKAIVITGVASFISTASAYQINPLVNKYWPGSNPSIAGISASPLHEEITHRARKCEETGINDPAPILKCSTDGPSPGARLRGNKYDALVRGVWWNDDPNQLLFGFWGDRHAKWVAWMRDGKGIAQTGRNYRGKKAEISQTYYIQYRSHYGDLQFLHAMASADNQPALVTQANILAWAEFTYQVATRRIDAETKFKDVKTTNFQNYFSKQPGWTINYLFAPTYRLSSPDYTSQMALGSLLHVIQDSYSLGHTLRDFKATAACPSGRVIQYYSYVHQDSDRHHMTDTPASWRAQGLISPQDPVSASATVLRFANQHAEWPVVRDYLQKVVFCTDNDAIVSGPGKYRTSKMAQVTN
ncbi:hypothetical protein [Pseudomonas chlororaphis]|uniref:hypothetical protein n=1 Tax=Pseudomonas chlororaphis TaxID=587753 RepID=UPI0012D3019C|nr:hypothetical protein [Pseudomonas chlororaphis]